MHRPPDQPCMPGCIGKQVNDMANDRISVVGKNIGKKEALAQELEEYKKALIFEYVTGKKEVPA